jgi:VanZ family protein
MRDPGSRIKAPVVSPFRVWGPLVFWLAMMFFFSSLHKTPLPKSKIIPWDKFAHISEYAIMGYLAARAMFFSGKEWLKSNYRWMTILFGLFYGASDEFHQYFVRGRDASIWDLAADVVGATLGSLLFYWLLLKGRYQSVYQDSAESSPPANENLTIQ